MEGEYGGSEGAGEDSKYMCDDNDGFGYFIGKK
jgi:hypothetical protein